jgi:alpha-N-acetylglucosamine transferase
MTMNWQAIGMVIALLLLGGWNALREYRDYKRKKMEFELTEAKGLAPNPERCEDHEDRLRKIEGTCSDIKTDVAVMKQQIFNTGADVENIWHKLDNK